MKINIDKNSGFCWGVVRTIDIAEQSLENADGADTYVLGQIIHNPKESERLKAKGLGTITHNDFEKLKGTNSQIIIRAHGEPPSTFRKADEYGLKIIDATCPLVTKLQDRIRDKYEQGWQIVIYGKNEHAEVIGLNGVCNNEAVIITSLEEAWEKVDLSKKTILFSQTTMDKSKYFEIRDSLKLKVTKLMDGGDIKDTFLAKDSICNFVYGREDKLREFSRNNDVIIFVAGRNSSNGKSLFDVCKAVNDRCFFIEDIDEIDITWLDGAGTVGITGATSTPEWFMQKVKDKLDEMLVMV